MQQGALFDHLVGGGEQRRRHDEAERPGGLGVDIAAGDVAVLPPGPGHQCLMASADFLVVGAYPPIGTYDECRGTADEHDRAVERIANTPHPDKDPLYGVSGPLWKLWKLWKSG